MLFRALKNPLTTMAESVGENLSESSDDSSASYVLSSDSIPSSDSREEGESNEETPAASLSQEKRKPKQSGSSAAKSTRSGTRTKKGKDATLNDEEMETLVSWIFSSEESNKVETEVRATLKDDPQIKLEPERIKVVEHILGVAQKQLFQLLIAGFCRKFSTLAKEAFDSKDKYKKAAFSVSWMKFLANFLPGKPTQERMILERLLANLHTNSRDEVHCVVSVIHELVYSIIHEHVRLRKTESETAGEGINGRRCQLSKESDDTLYRYCGAALQRMIKLRKETLAGKKGRGDLSKQRKPVMEQELEILQQLVMKDKSAISSSLKNLDEGNVVFPRAEMITFLRSVDNEVREFATDSNLRRYPSKFLSMCQNAVLNNETLEMDFRLLVVSLTNLEDTDTEIMVGLFKDLVSKLANTRINEFMNARIERELKGQNKVVDADEMLRPRLKAYALATKRK